MTPHISAQNGDYSEFVLLPGDPLRAQWLAKTFLDKVECVNKVRNCLGFTGFYKGVRISVQATGMGQPSAAIYIHELLSFFSVKTLIRIGTCGGLNTKVKVRDLVFAQAASTNSAMNRRVFSGYDFAPCASFDLLSNANDIAISKGLPHHIGGIVSNDVFYNPNGIEEYEMLRGHGVLAVEMETSTLYTHAARFGADALSICTMSDCLITGEQIDANQRESSLAQMAELALELALNQSDSNV